MAILGRRMRRVTTVAATLIACLILAELYYYYTEAPTANDFDDNGAHKIVKKPFKQVEPIKRQKTAEEIESSRSSRLDFTKTQAAVQAKRKAALRGSCERRGVQAQDSPTVYTQRHIYVVDGYKVMYCFMPKVGCSNWKRILMVLDGQKDSVDGLTSEEVHLKARLKFLHSYTAEEQAHRLQTYRKFFFVREPFKRALSVYRNKFENLEYYRGNKFFQRFGKQIVQKFKKHASEHDLQTGENASWSEFVDYLTHPAERAEVEKDFTMHHSDHWAEMHKICSPCTIDYDVIGNLETVATDAEYLLQMIGAPSKVKYISSAGSRPTNSSDSGTFHKYFSKLTDLQLTKLWDVYKLDYELFGYPKPEVVPG